MLSDAPLGVFSGTVYGHAAAEHAISVGATSYPNTPGFGVSPPIINDFSSGGPVRIYFDEDGIDLPEAELRNGVDFVSVDGTNTTFFLDSDFEPDGNPNFFGTSASAPHLAAIAALLLQEDPTLSPEEIRAIFERNSIDMDDPLTEGFDTGVDTRTGFGFVDAAQIAEEINDAPVAVDDLFEVSPDAFPVTLDLLGNDFDPNGQAITLIDTNASLIPGTITDNGDGTVTYDPGLAFAGLEPDVSVPLVFDYTIEDQFGLTDRGAANLVITRDPAPVIDLLVARPDQASVAENEIVVIDVLANDLSANGVFIESVSTAGVLGSPTTNGSTITYDPAGAFNGLGAGDTARHTFTYTISDDSGTTSTASVRVTVEGTNSAPVGLNTVRSGTPDTAFFINLTLVDPDEGDTPRIEAINGAGAEGNALKVDVDTIYYVPSPEFESLMPGESATDSFEILISDGNGAQSLMTVDVIVTPDPRGPVAQLATAGDDVIHVTGFDAPMRHFGMQGADTLILPATLDEIEIEPISSFRITPDAGAPIEVSSVETLVLDDAVLTLDTSNAVQTILLAYETFFGRFAQPEGLGFWADQLASGYSPQAMAADFSASPEFAERYGEGLGPRQFVEQLYFNTLKRAGDPDGIDHWTERLESGAWTRGDVGHAFMVSDELAERMADVLEDGGYLV